MVDTLKVLGQALPSAATLAPLYIAPAQATVSSIVACNQGPTATTMRLAVQPAGAAIAPQHYQIYDVVLQPNESRAFVIGITLGATDVVSVQSASGLVSFSAYGVEVS